MRDLGVYVINYNTTQLSIDALSSVLSRYDELDIFLLDNSEIQDEILVKYCSDKPNLRYYKSDVNLGFAAGMNFLLNIGIESGKRVHFFMNSDSALLDNSLYNAYKLILQNDFGILGLINEDSNGVEWQSGKNIKYGGLSIQRAKPSSDICTECDYVPGSSLMTTSEVFSSVGGLNEEYFAYYEEVEFCLRVKKSGRKVAFVNDSRIFHEPGRSSESRLKIYLKMRNRMYFIKRNFPRFYVVKNILLVVLFMIKRPVKTIRNIRLIIYAIRDYSSNTMFFTRVL